MKNCRKLDLSFLFLLLLERNLFKNISKVPAFLWQTQIQMNEFGLNDTKRIKKEEKLYW